MTEREREELAELVAEKIVDKQGSCSAFTKEEQTALKELVRVKKHTVKIFFYVFGALALYALKDLYNFIMGHLSIK